MSSLVRSSVLEGYESLARSMGVDPLAELTRVGLPHDALRNPASFISFVAFVRLLEHSAHVGECKSFGLRLARLQGALKPGPLQILMRHSSTLETAFQIGSTYLYLLSPDYHFYFLPVKEDAQMVDLAFDINVPQLRSRVQTMEHGICFILQLMLMATGHRVRPIAVLIPHKNHGPLATYAALLGCECSFERPFAAVRLAVRDLSFPLPERNPLLQQMAVSYIEKNFRVADELFSNRVRLLVRQFLRDGIASQLNIAKALAVHPKTLQRRLSAEGKRFDDILDEVRRNRFIELISQPLGLSLTQLALKLGYSEQAALTRSCRRWFGCTPTKIRNMGEGMSVLIGHDY